MAQLVSELDIKLNPRKFRVGNFYCPVCSTRIDHFERVPDKNFEEWYNSNFKFSIFQLETLNILDYKCPNCGATDRDRLYALFFDRYLDKSRELSLLDVAPCKGLSKYLRRQKSLRYRSADLYMSNVDDKVDITDMAIYPDQNFDIILCSHVLEHVENDEQALREFFRVMKSGGWGIFMVPILTSLGEDYEPVGINSEADRWHHFGQGDHVRMYSKHGFLKKLAEAGFRVKCFDINFFGEEAFTRSGISSKSVLYVGEKL